MRRRSDQSARARSDRPYQLCGISSAAWHPSSSTAFILFLLSFFLLFWRPLIPFLLLAATTLPSAERYPARSQSSWIYGWVPRRSHIVICRVVLHEWPAIRKSSAVVLVCAWGVRTCTGARGSFGANASACETRARARTSFVRVGYILKRWNVRATVIVDGFKCIRF